MIWIDQFAYKPADATLPDGTVVSHSGSDTQFRQLSWFLTSFDWDPVKELGVSVGYYNLATVIGLDGKYRNPLWSPDARVFFSLTAHLDAIYDDATHKKAKPATAALPNSAF
jgi:hypothetical protein